MKLSNNVLVLSIRTLFKTVSETYYIYEHPVPFLHVNSFIVLAGKFIDAHPHITFMEVWYLLFKVKVFVVVVGKLIDAHLYQSIINFPSIYEIFRIANAE